MKSIKTIIIVICIMLSFFYAGYRVGSHTTHIEPYMQETSINEVNNNKTSDSNSDNDKISNVSSDKNKIASVEDYSNIDFILNNREKIDESIKEKALGKWEDDYNMVEYEINKQTDSLNEILEDIDNKDKDILEKALEKWEDDYNMVIYEYKKQANAKKNIGL